MSKTISRRSLLKRSAVTAAALSVPWTARSWAAVAGANEDIRIATIGVRGRGKSHTDAFSKMKGVRLVAICDADEAELQNEYDRLMSGGSKSKSKPATKPAGPAVATASGAAPATQPSGEGKTPLRLDTFTDLRKILDNKEIDAVSIATPNHWHSLAAIWACQAGKDVYVEKPVSHNVWEGRQLVDAARKYDRIVQAGTQSRSNPAIREAFEWVRAGIIGKIKVARGLCYKRRGTIGKVEGGVGKVPETVDYDLWLGPRAKEPPRRKQFHYDWHWFWAYGNGDIGNQGIHQMDLARWALGKDTLAPKVMSVGGRFGYDDDGQTPNTQFVVHDYGDSMIIFEVRGLEDEPHSGKMPKYRGQDVGHVIECEGGYLSGTTIYDNDDRKIRTFELPGGKEEEHFANFIKGVRSRKTKDLNADILDGHLSSALCHTSNISYRLGQEARPAEIHQAMKANRAAMETFERFVEHLEVNDVSIAEKKAILGPMLSMDVKTERFVDNDDANKLLRDAYRAPFTVPEQV